MTFPMKLQSKYQKINNVKNVRGCSFGPKLSEISKKYLFKILCLSMMTVLCHAMLIIARESNCLSWFGLNLSLKEDTRLLFLKMPSRVLMGFLYMRHLVDHQQ